MHGLEFIRLNDIQHLKIDRLLATPLRRILRLPPTVHPLLILALFGLPSSRAVRLALILKFAARASTLPPSHPTRMLLDDQAQRRHQGSLLFAPFHTDLTIAKKYITSSPELDLTSARLFSVARSISLVLLRQEASRHSSILHFLQRNPSFSYSSPSFLKKDSTPAAIMRCRLLLANSHFFPLIHSSCPSCSLYPFTSFDPRNPSQFDLPDALDHLSSCSLLVPFSNCNLALRSLSLSPLSKSSLLSIPRSSRFVSTTSHLLRALYFLTFPP